MLEALKRYVEAGREALTPKKAEDLARALVDQGQARADQAGRLARDLLEWSRQNSERLVETVRREVTRQMAKAGVATKDEVDALKRRIRQLERQAREGGAEGTTSTAKKSTAKKSTAKKSTAMRPTPPGKPSPPNPPA